MLRSKGGLPKLELGVGVSVVIKGRLGTIQSEFDLISRQAVNEHGVRRSIHHIPFQTWLPLPISHSHWRRVQSQVPRSLSAIASAAKLDDPDLALYGFMTDIVVRLNLDLEGQEANRIARQDDWGGRSTLRHASEKVIESYFHLFHLLLCHATSPSGQGLVPAANRMIHSFMAGKTSKTDIPNLGYLLIALLISDVEVRENIMKAIITEAITRNVVWLLDRRGAAMAELAYLEADEVSEYRLKKTFEGSKTSYRLLMFSELFRRVARPDASASAQGKQLPLPPQSLSPASATEAARAYESYRAAAVSTTPASLPTPPSTTGSNPLVQLRDELFDRHGAPPPGAAGHLASEVRRMQKIEDFPSFLREMGIATIPTKANFTSVLRSTVQASMDRGYSRQGMSQRNAAALRCHKDHCLDERLIPREYFPLPGLDKVLRGNNSFFPDKPKAGKPDRGGRNRR